MNSFADLTPNYFLPALEQELEKELTALVRPLPSYINRVYELQAADETYYVVKFYRPGRWDYRALQDEHNFLSDCAEIDIPVVCPVSLKNGSTLGKLGETVYTIFPRRAGRQFDVEKDDDWVRVGRLLGRLHNAGQKRKAKSRLVLTPAETTGKYVEQLCHDSVTKDQVKGYRDICSQIVKVIAPLFKDLETIRIHGDFHRANILHRPPHEELMVIDFDDMMNGPPVQDIWLLMPDHYPACRRYLDLTMEGYRQFRNFDIRSYRVIEGLRAMRMIYFTAWCGMQRKDRSFQEKFPDWGGEGFWNREIRDLREQYAKIMESLEPSYNQGY